MDTVREIVKQKDGCDDAAFDALLESVAAAVANGADAEEAVRDHFGLEFCVVEGDKETQDAIEAGLQRRAV